MTNFKPLTKDNHLTCLRCGSPNTATEESDIRDVRIVRCIECGASGTYRSIPGMLNEPTEVSVDSDNFALLTTEGVKRFQEVA